MKASGKKVPVKEKIYAMGREDQESKLKREGSETIKDDKQLQQREPCWKKEN